jgi:hypothetical protein
VKVGQGSSCAVPFVAGSPRYRSQKIHIVVVSEASSVFAGVDREPQRSQESVLSFGPALSPLDTIVGQRVVPYIPTMLGSSIPHTGPTSKVVYASMNTVTAGCSHPAASTSFVTPTMEASRAQKRIKGLGIGFPTGLKQRLSRRSSGIPTSEACQDLASLAAPVTFKLSRPRRFQGPMLSPIPEVDDSQPDPYSTPETRPTPSPTKRRHLFRRALKFLF